MNTPWINQRVLGTGETICQPVPQRKVSRKSRWRMRFYCETQTAVKNWMGILWSMAMNNPSKPAPKGFRWVFCRYRRVKNSDRMLDAHDYGRECWAFLVPHGG